MKAVLLALNYPGISILIMRRTYPDLLETHIYKLREMTVGAARYKTDEKLLTFENRSRVKFGYCDSEGDLLQYQGREYDVIFIDEATQFEEMWFQKLTACVRGVNAFPKRIYLTCNPGGVGHAWVKRLFLDRDFHKNENPDDYRFIKATVYDNAALMKADPEYIKALEALPEKEREKWLHGNWNVFEGQYFSEWDEDIHTMHAFPIPHDWRMYFAMDYGLDMFAGYYIAMSPLGRAYVVDEIYEKDKIVPQAAKLCKQNKWFNRTTTFIAPPDLWNRRNDTGRSAADIFRQEGVYLQKASNDRVQGWYDLKRWLAPYTDTNGQRVANLVVFKNCINLISCIPMLCHDDRDYNDCAKTPHDITHGPDALRYFVAKRPTTTQVKYGDSLDGEIASMLAFGA